jgi:hypothetical protein
MKIRNISKALLYSVMLIAASTMTETAYASEIPTLKTQSNSINYISNNLSTELSDKGDYIETVIISDMPLPSANLKISALSTSKSITKTKTTYYKNTSGSVMWSVSITATFTYNGSKSKCTSYSHSTSASSKTWSIKSSSSSKSGNKAIAKVIATHTDSDGSKYDVSKSVTISCNANGVVS